MLLANIDESIRNIALKIRKIRELKGLTREVFCEKLNENPEYWGQIERGEQAISLPKLLQVCEVYNIPIEELCVLETNNTDNQIIIESINDALENCNKKQLEIAKKFIDEILLAI